MVKTQKLLKNQNQKSKSVRKFEENNSKCDKTKKKLKKWYYSKTCVLTKPENNCDNIYDRKWKKLNSK